MLHEYFKCSETSDTVKILESLASDTHSKFSRKQPLKTCVEYFRKFVFLARCCGENMLPDSRTLMQIFAGAFPAH